jgi:hypothetical protein
VLTSSKQDLGCAAATPAANESSCAATLGPRLHGIASTLRTALLAGEHVARSVGFSVHTGSFAASVSACTQLGMLADVSFCASAVMLAIDVLGVAAAGAASVWGRYEFCVLHGTAVASLTEAARARVATRSLKENIVDDVS